MNKVLFLFVFVLAFSVQVKSQIKYYQEFGKTRVLTQAEFEQKKKVVAAKSAASSYRITTELNIVKEKTYSDSIICIYKKVSKFDNGATIDLYATQSKVYQLVNKPFPDFKLFDIEGVQHQLADYFGKPLVINFWFNGCGPCKKEMPVLNQIKSEYDVHVNFISITYNTAEEVKTVLAKHPFDFTHLVDAKQLIDEINVGKYPKTLIIDEKGYVRQIMECVESTIDVHGKVVLGNGDKIRKEIEKIM